MNGMRTYFWALPALLLVVSPSSGQDLVVNGYTYIAPSYYPVPPIVVYDPAFVIPARSVLYPLQYAPPVPMIYAEPAFMTQTMVPYNPTWNYPPVMVPAPMGVREKVRFNRNGLDYKYKAYVPGRAAPVYSYEIDSERNGVKIRERYR